MKFQVNYLFNSSQVHQLHLIVPVLRGGKFGFCILEPQDGDCWNGPEEFETAEQAIAAGKSNLAQYLAELE